MALTPEQQRLLDWLKEQGGSGYVDRFGRVVAGGETKPKKAFPAWLNLVAKGFVAGEEDRLYVTDAGKEHPTAG